MTRTKRALTEGAISPQLITLAFPLILGDILQQLYNTIDAVVIGRVLGQTAFAAAGVAGTVMNLFVFILAGCCTGFSVVLAQSYGSGDYRIFRQVHFSALSSGLCAALTMGSLGALLCGGLLRLIGTPAEVAVYSRVYLQIILAGLPATFLYNFYSAVLRAVGDTRTGLLFLTLAMALNLGLDILLVAVLDLGIGGAAFATVIAQAVSASLCLLYLKKRMPELLFRKENRKFDRISLKKIWSLGAVTALHQSSLYLGKLLVQGAVNPLGTDAISAYTATCRIEGFINSFGTSGSAALSVFTAQNRGAGRWDRVEQGFWTQCRLLTIFGLASSLVLYLVGGSAMGLLLGESGSAAWVSGTSYLRLMAFFYLLAFLNNCLTGHFQGVALPLIPFCGTTCHIFIRVLLSYTLSSRLGLDAVAWGTGIGWAVGFAFWFSMYCITNQRRRKRLSL